MDNRRRRTNQRYGFTLAEAVVVVGVVALLTSIPTASVSRSRERARRAVCAANQKQIVAAAHLYAQENEDVLPLVIAVPQETSNYTWLSSFGIPWELYYHLGGYNGLGLLTRAGIIADHKTLFCPSGYHLFPINESPVWTAYYWRFYSAKGASDTWPLLSRQPPRKALTADVFALHDSRYIWGQRFVDNPLWHGGGMMVSRIDASVTWTPDHGNYIRDAMLPTGPFYGRPRNLMFYIWGRLDQDLGW